MKLKKYLSTKEQIELLTDRLKEETNDTMRQGTEATIKILKLKVANHEKMLEAIEH